MNHQTINVDQDIKENDKQENSVVRFLFENHGVRGEIIHMCEPMKELISHHQFPKSIKSLMLELGAASVLLAATLKANGAVTVQIQGGEGDNAINFAFINIDKNLNFYGNVSLNEDKQYHDDCSFKDLMGKNAVLVISAFPENGARFQSIVPLVEDSLAKNLEEYFKNSEQLHSSFILHHDIEKNFCAGIMLQIIPNIENNTQSLDHLNTLSQTITTQELYELSLNECLRRLFWNDQIRVFEAQEIHFQCTCSKERFINALLSMSYEQVKEMSEDDNGITLTCQNCNKQYYLSQDEMRCLLDRHPLFDNAQNKEKTIKEDTVVNVK